jgi:processing peptidase subunit beta
LGIRENIANITEDHIKDFHAANYIGKNFYVVGTGNVSHDSFVGAVEKHFGKFPAEAPAGSNTPNAEQPFFTPSMLYMRDDEMANVNIGVFF